jgi:hypothetical protein
MLSVDFGADSFDLPGLLEDFENHPEKDGALNPSR